MRYPLFLCCLFGSFWLQAQISAEDNQYEQWILNYNIPQTLPADQRQEANDLKAQIKLLTQEGATDFTLDDYLDALHLMLLVNELPENLQTGLTRIRRAQGGCTYFAKMEATILEEDIYRPIRSDWKATVRECDNQRAAVSYPAAYRGNLTSLQIQLDQLQRIDDIIASGDINPYENDLDAVQDQHNRQIINELYEKHGKYIGLDMVGQQFASRMWMAITKSSADYIERYLPVLRQAVLERQLPLASFQQTLSRYCFLTTGTHLYNWLAVPGEPVADSVVRKRIEERYGFR